MILASTGPLLKQKSIRFPLWSNAAWWVEKLKSRLQIYRNPIVLNNLQLATQHSSINGDVVLYLREWNGHFTNQVLWDAQFETSSITNDLNKLYPNWRGSAIGLRANLKEP